MTDAEERRTQDLRAADEKYPALQKEIDARRDEAMKQADERYPRRLTELQERFERDSQALQASYKAQKETTQREHDEAYNHLVARWTTALDEVKSRVARVREEENRYFFNWNGASYDTWTYPEATVVPPGLRFGEFVVDLEKIPGGVPSDPRLKDCSARPATLCPRSCRSRPRARS